MSMRSDLELGPSSSQSSNLNPNGSIHEPLTVRHLAQGAHRLISGTSKITLSQPWIHQQDRRAPSIGSSEDVVQLIATIFMAWKQGNTTRAALESLHNVNSCPASAWKDYYLENDRKIIACVNELKQQMAMTAPATPRATTVGRSASWTDSLSRELDPLTALASEGVVVPPSSQGATPTPEFSGSAAQPVSRAHASPSHSGGQSAVTSPPPIPPLFESSARQLDGKIRYTDADKTFYLSYLRWRVKHDPGVKRTALSAELHRLAPHHSVSSWASYYRTHREEVDGIFGAPWAIENLQGNGGDSSEDDEDDEDDEKRSSAKDRSSDRSSNAEHDQHQPFEHLTGASIDSWPDTDDDKEDMGRTREKLTDADLRMVARATATKEDWKNLSFQEQSECLHHMYPQRSDKGWGHCLKRRREDIAHYIGVYKEVLHRRVQNPERAESGDSDIEEIPASVFTANLKRRRESVVDVVSMKRRATITS